MSAAKQAAANVVRLEPDWTGGGYPEAAAMLFVEGARKAGISACVPAVNIGSMRNLVRLRSCDEERVRRVDG